MKWKNANRDGLPGDKQEVTISVEGVNYTAVYEAATNSFRVKGADRLFSVTPNGPLVYWQHHTNP